jgi:sugar phosphate isomerase/epimerase
VPKVLDLAVGLGIECLEFASGDWSPSPHVNLTQLVSDDGARRPFLRAIQMKDLAISALNCSGNPLQGGDLGKAQQRITRETIWQAAEPGVERAVLMSGCPPAKGDSTPNWITAAWPPELAATLLGSGMRS